VKVVLYETDYCSPFSVICSLVTASGYSHGAIYNNGVLYDSTFISGCFDLAQPITGGRNVVVIDVSGDCEKWITDNLYAQYDLAGLLLYPLGVHSESKLYCFESVCDSLKSIGIDLNLGNRKSGGKILDKLLEMGYKAELMRGEDFNKVYL